MKLSLFLFFCLLIQSCTLANENKTDEILINSGFENGLDDWSGAYTTHNNVIFITANSMEGDSALLAYAEPTADLDSVSKAFVQIEDEPNNLMRFYGGDQIYLSAWVYVVGTESLQGLFILDLESTSCWVDQFGANPSPGIRLMFREGDYLIVERGKIGYSNIGQNSYRFPHDEWVHVEWWVSLNDDINLGWVILSLNGNQVINISCETLPNAKHFALLLNMPEFYFNEPVYYDRVQIGITANASSNNAIVLVDNVLFTKAL